MKKILAISIASLTLALTTVAAPIEISISGDTVTYKKGDTEYSALVTDPGQQLVEVRVWKGTNSQLYGVSYEVPTHTNDDGTIILGVKDWWKHQRAWESIQKEVKFTGADSPEVRMAEPRVTYFLEEVSETTYVLKSVTNEHRCHYPKRMLAFPPPLGKQFQIGVLRNQIVPVIIEPDGRRMVQVGIQ